jgi:hypothetical protein
MAADIRSDLIALRGRRVDDQVFDLVRQCEQRSNSGELAACYRLRRCKVHLGNVGFNNGQSNFFK